MNRGRKGRAEKSQLGLHQFTEKNPKQKQFTDSNEGSVFVAIVESRESLIEIWIVNWDGLVKFLHRGREMATFA